MVWAFTYGLSVHSNHVGRYYQHARMTFRMRESYRNWGHAHPHVCFVLPSRGGVHGSTNDRDRFRISYCNIIGVCGNWSYATNRLSYTEHSLLKVFLCSKPVSCPLHDKRNVGRCTLALSKHGNRYISDTRCCTGKHTQPSLTS